MICTVSTVLDTPENVERFVRRNLAAGVDHMFVFLDEHQPRVRALLDPLPQVTAIGTGDGYWDGRRPPNLNNRQTANANLARVLLSCLDWPRWLFHIDADECLDIDRTKLLALDETVPAVVLTTLEAVSTPGGDPQERFKRQLGEEDLALLHLLGIIGRPSNTSLFNSHAHGKVGIRPTLDFNLHIHRARYPDRDFVEVVRGGVAAAAALRLDVGGGVHPQVEHPCGVRLGQRLRQGADRHLGVGPLGAAQQVAQRRAPAALLR